MKSNWKSAFIKMNCVALHKLRRLQIRLLFNLINYLLQSKRMRCILCTTACAHTYTHHNYSCEHCCQYTIFGSYNYIVFLFKNIDFHYKSIHYSIFELFVQFSAIRFVNFYFVFKTIGLSDYRYLFIRYW